jgi:hypothetical protein
MALIKKRFIAREEISRLLWVMDREISTHDLSMWLKSKTDDEWVVVPRDFVVSIVNFFENEFKEFGITDKLGQNQFLYEIKKYL